MIRHLSRILALAMLAVVVGCAGAPDPAAESAWSPRLQAFPFSGVADPASGRLQLAAVPAAALQPITEDRNGTAFLADANTVEIYGPTVTFPAGGNGYPAGCNTGAPVVMRADVHVTSGFAAQQLRNVYARITSLSAGPTFCTVASPGAFGGQLGTFGGNYFGLYLYAPLDFGTQAPVLGDAGQELLEELVELVLEELVAASRGLGTLAELQELHAVGVHPQLGHVTSPPASSRAR